MTGSNKNRPAQKAATGRGGAQAKGDLSAALSSAPSAMKQLSAPPLEELVKSGQVPIFLDANVLIPQYLRTVVLDMAAAGLFQPYWSKGVLEETRRNLINPEVYGIEVEKVNKLLKAMETGFKNALVHGTEKFDEIFEGRTDWKDQHVAAGALKVSQSTYGGMPVALVTHNAKDLPQWAFEGSPVLRVRPDTLLAQMTRTWPDEVNGAMQKMLRRLKDPKLSETDLLDYMVGAGCPVFAEELAKLWGFDLVDELSPARLEQLPKSKRPAAAKKAAPKKTAAAKKATKPKGK